MFLGNSRRRFGAVSQAFHWLTLALVATAFTLGLVVDDLGFSPMKLRLTAYHKWVGISVLALTVLRLGWRWANAVPDDPPGTPGWQRFGARASHVALYALMFLVPLAGWTMSSALNAPVVVFGIVPLPDLVSPDPALGKALRGVHGLLANLMLAVIALHAAAALYHHYYLKDEVLRRMLPGAHIGERET